MNNSNRKECKEKERFSDKNLQQELNLRQIYTDNAASRWLVDAALVAKSCNCGLSRCCTECKIKGGHTRKIQKSL